jgi:protein-S-isoprenylcysteine O-methyltransferase Ste14
LSPTRGHAGAYAGGMSEAIFSAGEVRPAALHTSLSPALGADVSALRSAILVAWAVFWIYWLVSAAGAKHGSRGLGARSPGVLIVVALVLLRIFKGGTLAVHAPIVQAVGLVLFAAGLGLAVWARLYLGRNWGMPMTEKDEPELVTSGPYHLVRHPIYSGILLAVLGTALSTNLYWLVAAAVMGVYFVYSARVEERLLASAFPATYPSYRTETKMLIPFVL